MGKDAVWKGEKELCILSEVYVTLGLGQKTSNIIACIRVLFHLSCKKNDQLKNLHGAEVVEAGWKIIRLSEAGNGDRAAGGTCYKTLALLHYTNSPQNGTLRTDFRRLSNKRIGSEIFVVTRLVTNA